MTDRGQKWSVILGMLWLACHNPEIDWRTGEVKMTRCSEECGKQWRPKQGKSGWQKQKKEQNNIKKMPLEKIIKWMRRTAIAENTVVSWLIAQLFLDPDVMDVDEWFSVWHLVASHVKVFWSYGLLFLPLEDKDKGVNQYTHLFCSQYHLRVNKFY